MTKKQIKILVKVWTSSILTHHGFEYSDQPLSEDELKSIQDEVTALSIKIGGQFPTFTTTDGCIKYVRENIK